MKKQRRISTYLTRATLLAAAGIISLVSVLTFMPIPQAHAIGEEYALYFNDDPATKRAVADAWQGKNNYGDPGWSKMQVLATGGFWGDGATLPFDEKLTNEFAQTAAGVTTGNEPFFSKRYFCGKDDGVNKITFTRPPEDQAYYEVFYAVGLYSTDNNGDTFVTRSSYDAAKGVASVQSFALTPGGFNRRTTVYDITTVDKGPGDLAKDNGNQNDSTGRFGISDANQKCRPEFGNFNLPRFQGLSSTAKEKFKKAATTAADSIANGGGNPDAPQADCDTKASSPLSWIICPVVDLGANLSDFVFKDIVAPLLKDVPVSTDSGTPSFKTWQQFRLIGNIILVGSLLAIVYSQTKGSK